MSRAYIGHFQVIPRKRRARNLVPTIRRASKKFKGHLAGGNSPGMESTSKEAWDAMTQLFEVLRNEQDHGNLSDALMDESTALLANNLSGSEQQAMILAKKLNRSNPTLTPLSLRNTLNKI